LHTRQLGHTSKAADQASGDGEVGIALNWQVSHFRAAKDINPF
jgi:hypothetical protein